jgi:hypothetical protein
LVSGDPWADGSAGIDSNFNVIQRHGYLLLFRAKPDAYFLISFGFGPFNDQSYRAFWIENAQSYSLWSGQNQIIFSRSLNFQYKSDTWYFLLVWLNSDGIEGKIWEKENPAISKKFSVDTGKEWANSQLHYGVGVAEGTVEIDEFQELEF